MCKNEYLFHRATERNKYNNVHTVLSTVPVHQAGAQKGLYIIQRTVPYLHNSNSIKFFPAMGYNLSPVSLIHWSFWRHRKQS